jgi:hypothetical protein
MANFREPDTGEVRRIHLLGTWVNKARRRAEAARDPGPPHSLVPFGSGRLAATAIREKAVSL